MRSIFISLFCGSIGATTPVPMQDKHHTTNFILLGPEQQLWTQGSITLKSYKKAKRSKIHATLRSPVVNICTTSLTFTNPKFCPHSVCMCFAWISEQTAIISLYNIN